ncbi:MAG TPA: sigma-E factor regulatory protein RseB domain-containing protein [Mycobacteriales bacterium]|nr:sigma-E factor regulatory protein RseB domain-containing protein [Mycobacteriales bacterium]
MRGLRIAAALTGLGALLCAGPARALLPPEPQAEETPVVARSAVALALLERAAQLAHAQSWRATERVLSLASGAPVVTVAEVQHGIDGHGAVDALDPRLFSLLASHYELLLAGQGICDGHRAQVVEVRRPGSSRALVGRFWVDVRSGLVLRREVLDDAGALLRRTDLLDVRVATPAATLSTGLTASPPLGERLDAAELAAVEATGVPVVRTLPGHLDLYDARRLPGDVLQLAYSDGLSTLSLFVQRGAMPATATGVVRTVGGGQVWQSPGEPERVVWSADGRTWTLVSDAAPAVVDEVLLVLPHTRRQVGEDGVAPRVWRGMSRVGSWLNPFA